LMPPLSVSAGMLARMVRILSRSIAEATEKH
jgi:hypothetical protein